MNAFDQRGRTEAVTRLRDLIEIGHRYDLFARNFPSKAASQIAELNAPGVRENAWDLLWVPDKLRAKIARVSSILVLELCGMPGDPQHEPALMDAMMPAAIVTACVVGHLYGVASGLPTHAQQGRLDAIARLLHRLTREQPQDLEAIGRAEANTLPLQHPPIVACLPRRIRDRLIDLAHIMTSSTDPVHQKILTVIFTIGAVAAETFEPLNFAEVVSGPMTSAQ